MALGSSTFFARADIDESLPAVRVNQGSLSAFPQFSMYGLEVVASCRVLVVTRCTTIEPVPISLRLLSELMRWAFCLAFDIAGSSMLARIARIAMTARIITHPSRACGSCAHHKKDDHEADNAIQSTVGAVFLPKRRVEIAKLPPRVAQAVGRSTRHRHAPGEGRKMRIGRGINLPFGKGVGQVRFGRFQRHSPRKPPSPHRAACLAHRQYPPQTLRRGWPAAATAPAANPCPARPWSFGRPRSSPRIWPRRAIESVQIVCRYSSP